MDRRQTVDRRIHKGSKIVKMYEIERVNGAKTEQLCVTNANVRGKEEWNNKERIAAKWNRMI